MRGKHTGLLAKKIVLGLLGTRVLTQPRPFAEVAHSSRHRGHHARSIRKETSLVSGQGRVLALQKSARMPVRAPEKVVLTLKRDEARTRNAGCHLTPCIEGHSRISSHMHHERRRSHLTEKPSDIEVTRGVDVASRALWGARPSRVWRVLRGNTVLSRLLAEEALDDAQELDGAVRLRDVVIAARSPSLLLIPFHRVRVYRDDRRRLEIGVSPDLPSSLVATRTARTHLIGCCTWTVTK